MTQDQFEFAITKLYDCFGKNINQKQIDEWYNEINTFDMATLESSIRQLKRESDKFPTLSHLIQTLNSNKPRQAGVSTHWNGKPCTCDKGLIFFEKEIEGHLYSYVSRCPKCKAYDAPAIPFYDNSMEENRANFLPYNDN